MRQFVTSRLDGSVLSLPGNLRLEINFFNRSAELRVVASITLNANPLLLLGHSEDEGPPFFRIEVHIREHE